MASLLFCVLAIIAQLHLSGALPPRPGFVVSRKTANDASGDESSALTGTLQRRLQRPFAKVARQSLRKDLIGQCSERWRNATLDHFSRTPAPGDVSNFPQRYFVCASHWQRRTQNGGSGPIFFYLGNEADVTLYLNNSGLMWESAPDFGAMLVFAEHRYYGESVPYDGKVRKHMGYLMAEQAMADYAELVAEIKDEYDTHSSAVIGFGGSYGGMLAAWMRLKYPHVLDGSISASAPIWNFLGETPPFNSGSFAKGVTYDASEMAGSAPYCIENVKDTWDLLRIYGRDEQGRKFLAESLRMCPNVTLKDEDEVALLREWLAGAWDYMAMGNFPYPSAYITNGHGTLPAFPVRVACSYLDDNAFSDSELLEAMSQAVGVFYNHTGDVDCFDPFAGTDPDSDHDANFWDWQWCAEMLMPFSKDGEADMFWPEPFDLEAASEACQQNWGIAPRPLWATTEWGGRRIAAGSNIVFSNGLLDPWHGGGVLEDISDSLLAVVIPEGAHHLDLMFSHPDDPLSVIEVRKFQREAIKGWIEQAAPAPAASTGEVSGAGAGAGVKGGMRSDGDGHGAVSPSGSGCLMGRMWVAVREWVAGLFGVWSSEEERPVVSGRGGGRRWGEGHGGGGGGNGGGNERVSGGGGGGRGSFFRRGGDSEEGAGSGGMRAVA